MGEVDIIVRSKRTGRTVLAVEVKLGGSLQSAYEQLRRYMKLVGCPTGLVVLGPQLGLLEEDYGGAPAGTIEIVGEYDTSTLQALALPKGSGKEAAFEFERRVQVWLESLSEPSSLDKLPDDMKTALRDHVVPWIEVGEILATGPRPQLTSER